MKVSVSEESKDISVKEFGNVVVISIGKIKIELSRAEAMYIAMEIIRIMSRIVEESNNSNR